MDKRIKITRHTANDREWILITTDGYGENDIAKIVSADKYSESNCMYSHIVADILHSLDRNWQYDVHSEYVGDDWDKRYTCVVYHKHKCVFVSVYNEYNGYGENVSIEGTIKKFAPYGIEIVIDQTDGGWCFDE